MIVADFIQLVEERGMTHKYHKERFKDANGAFSIDGLLVSCGRESTFFTWGLINIQEQGLLEDLAQLEEKGTPKDYEAPRAEYPFPIPGEITERTDLFGIIDTLPGKREYVKRCIRSGMTYSEWFLKPIKDLAQEVGLADYYQAWQVTQETCPHPEIEENLDVRSLEKTLKCMRCGKKVVISPMTLLKGDKDTLRKIAFENFGRIVPQEVAK